MSGFGSTLSRSLGPAAVGVASREMDDLFDRLIQSNGNSPAKPWMFPVSIWEADEYFHLDVDLPGVATEDVDLTFEEGRLQISIKRERINEGRNYLHDERYWGEMKRVFSIPNTVDPESIEANYEEGVLQVRLAKRPEVLPKKIAITSK